MKVRARTWALVFFKSVKSVCCCFLLECLNARTRYWAFSLSKQLAMSKHQLFHVQVVSRLCQTFQIGGRDTSTRPPAIDECSNSMCAFLVRSRIITKLQIHETSFEVRWESLSLSLISNAACVTMMMTHCKQLDCNKTQIKKLTM